MASLLEILNMGLFGLWFEKSLIQGMTSSSKDCLIHGVFMDEAGTLNTFKHKNNQKSTIHSKTAEGQGSCIPGNGSKNPVKKRDPEMRGVGTNLTEALPIHGIRMGLQSPGLLSFRAVSCFEAWFWPRNGELFCIVQRTR